MIYILTKTKYINVCAYIYIYMCVCGCVCVGVGVYIYIGVRVCIRRNQKEVMVLRPFITNADVVQGGN